MEHTYNDGVLTIRLYERTDSTNADAVENEIFNLVRECGAKSVVLDAADTKYISSAGLRVILKLKKTIDNSKVINASPEVYEIFEMTGFSEIIDIEKALREISVEGCEKIGEGGFGIVYRIDDETIVKIYKSAGTDTIKREMNYAKQAFIKGVPTAISYDMVKCGDRYGVVFELIKSDTLANALTANPEKFDEYAEKYINLVKTVHSTDVSDIISARANDLYRDTFAKIKNHLTDEEYAELMRLFDAIPNRNTMVHGDLHARNIMIQNGELLLIDMDEITCGHPIYDLCNIYYAYTEMPKRGDADTMRYLGISADMCKRLVEKFNEKYFGGLTDDRFKAAVDGMNVFAQMRYAYLRLIVNSKVSSYEERVKGVVQSIKDVILPQVDTAIKSLEFIG